MMISLSKETLPPALFGQRQYFQVNPTGCIVKDSINACLPADRAISTFLPFLLHISALSLNQDPAASPASAAAGKNKAAQRRH
jgi:hypothetical protein